jgi:hypothetical protein
MINHALFARLEAKGRGWRHNIQRTFSNPGCASVNMNFEVDVIAVSDVERSNQGYQLLGRFQFMPPRLRVLDQFSNPDGHAWRVREVTTRIPAAPDTHSQFVHGRLSIISVVTRR